MKTKVLLILKESCKDTIESWLLNVRTENNWKISNLKQLAY